MRYSGTIVKMALLASLLALAACSGNDGRGSGGISAPVSSVPSSSTSISSASASASSTFSLVSLPTNPNVTVANLYALADFPIGAAVPVRYGTSVTDSPERGTIIANHFSQVTAENVMKPSFLHPEEGTYFWDEGDALVDWAASLSKSVHGHVLVWHSQIPTWVENYSGNQAQWETMMTSHITTIVDHFEGQLASWDVVNEALTDADPSGLRTDSPWYVGVGADYVATAFIAADAAESDVDLYYNDYNIVSNGAKTAALLVLLDDLAASDVPIDGVGFQMHIKIDWPSIDAMKTAWKAVVDRGLKVKISELDIKTSPDGVYADGLPLAVEIEQAQRYQEIVAAYLEVVPAAQRGGITVWGITDTDSWLSNWDVTGDKIGDGNQWALMFNGDFSPKRALQGFADGLSQ